MVSRSLNPFLCYICFPYSNPITPVWECTLTNRISRDLKKVFFLTPLKAFQNVDKLFYNKFIIFRNYIEDFILAIFYPKIDNVRNQIRILKWLSSPTLTLLYWPKPSNQEGQIYWTANKKEEENQNERSSTNNRQTDRL